MGRMSMVAQAVGGRLHGSDVEFSAISTDTRSLRPGQLFFALRGAHHDGTAFVSDAVRLGAAGAVVEARQAGDFPQVEVTDTRRALGDLARRWRANFQIPVIAITGSNGKTTVKEMTAAIMRAAHGAGMSASWNPAGTALGDPVRDPVLMTWGNLNNEVGLPITLLYLTSAHKAAVIELGASRRGDIAYLAGIAAPTIGLVTNAARAHLEGFGSVEDVAATKGELFEALPVAGTAVVNRDDRFYPKWWERSAGRQRVSFGLHPDATFRATAIAQTVESDGVRLQFEMCTPVGVTQLRLAMAGQHNVINALAAAAAAICAGATLEHVATGLSTMRNVPGRLRRIPGRRDIELYDDTYNANPGSVRAAILFLESLSGERWLVLGDMAELGPESAGMHKELGELARRSGISRLYCTGRQCRAAAEGFGAHAEWHDSIAALTSALLPALRPGVTVLVKGSRSMGMERVVQALTAASGAQGG